MSDTFLHHQWTDEDGNKLVVTEMNQPGSKFIVPDGVFDNTKLICADGKQIELDKSETVDVLAHLAGGREMLKDGKAKEVDEIIAGVSMSEARDMTDAVEIGSAPRPIARALNAMRNRCSKLPPVS